MDNLDKLIAALKSGHSSEYYLSPANYPENPGAYCKKALLDWLCGSAIDVHADIQNIDEKEEEELARVLVDMLELQAGTQIPLLTNVVLAGEKPYTVCLLIQDAEAFYQMRWYERNQRHKFTKGFCDLLDRIQSEGAKSVNDDRERLAHQLCNRAEEASCDIRRVAASAEESCLLVSVILAKMSKDITTTNGVAIPLPAGVQQYVQHDIIRDASGEYDSRHSRP